MTQYDPVTDYLMHYGRKGMKWHKHIFGEKNVSDSGNSRFVDNEYQQNLAYNSQSNDYGLTSNRTYTSNSQSSSGRYGPNRSLTVRRPYGQTMQYNQYKNGSEKVNITQRAPFYNVTGTVKYDSNTRKTSVGFRFSPNKRTKAIVSAAKNIAVSAAFGGVNVINSGRKAVAKFISKRI